MTTAEAWSANRISDLLHEAAELARRPPGNAEFANLLEGWAADPWFIRRGAGLDAARRTPSWNAHPFRSADPTS
jgi:hypothetical protein